MKLKKKQIIIIFCAAFILISALAVIKNKSDSIAKEALETTVNPFVFAEGESRQNIQNDFSVQTSSDNVKISWKSSDESIIRFEEGNAKVKRHQESETITLTMTCSYLLGSSSKKIDVIVTGNGELAYESIDFDKLRKGNIGRAIQYGYRKSDGRIAFMSGNICDDKIYNEQNALDFLLANRDGFGISERLVFKLANAGRTDDYTLYTFYSYLDDYRVEDNIFTITVDNEDFSVSYITNSAFITDLDLPEAKPISEEELISIIEETYGEVYLSIGYDKFIADGKRYACTSVISQKSICRVFVDEESRTIQKVYELNSDIWESDDWSSQITKISRLDGGSTTTTISKDNSTGTYYLYDKKRNISVCTCDKGEPDDVLNINPNPFVSSSRGTVFYLTYSKTGKFDNQLYSSETETYTQLQRVYDYYLNYFGLCSYDGKGSEIIANVNASEGTDNACWNILFNQIFVGKAEVLTNAVSCDDEALMHEYTHAVIDNMNWYSTLVYGYFANDTVNAIEEAYCDIFACLASNSTDWKIGENTIASGKTIVDTGQVTTGSEKVWFRDLKNITLGEAEIAFTSPLQYYDDPGFKDQDCHKQGVLIGHLGYEMYASGYFNNRELSIIMMKSLGYGYNNYSTFVTVRRNIISALRDLGYDKERQDFVAYTCDQMHIYDPYYTITTEKYITGLFGDSDDGLGVKDLVDPADHPNNSWVVVEEATCTKDGTRQLVCNDCGIVIYTETIEALGHQYNGDICTICGYDKNLCRNGHQYENYTCTKCGETIDTTGWSMGLDIADGYDEEIGFYTYISGIGSCTDTDIVIPRYSPEGKEINTIAYDAFCNNEKITSVKMTDSIEYIGAFAFFGAINMKTIELSNNLKIIGPHAFEKTGLEKLIMPNSVTKMYSDTFSSSDLVEIRLSNSLEEIPEYAFIFCEKLESVYIPDSVKVIGAQAFSYCNSLKSITLPNSLIELTMGAFLGCENLESITIPDSVEMIGDDTFEDCISLSSVILSSNIKTIEESTFLGCENLESITIPDSVTSIGYAAFSGCSGLKFISLPNAISKLEARLFSDCSSLESITIPDSVTIIEDSAFKGCTSLNSVTLSKNCESIGDSAFYDCSNLKTINIPESVKSISEFALNIQAYDLTIYYEGTIEQWNSIEGHDQDLVYDETDVYCSDGVVHID